MMISLQCEVSAPQVALKPFSPPDAGKCLLFDGAVVPLLQLQSVAGTGYQDFLAPLDMGQEA